MKYEQIVERQPSLSREDVALKTLLCFLPLLFACCTGVEAARVPYFAADKLIINGNDATRFHGAADVEATQEWATIPIELRFSLNGVARPVISKMTITCRIDREGWPATSSFAWNQDCSYESASRRGVFRIRAFPLYRRTAFRFSVDVSKLASNAPKDAAYSFSIHTYPALGGVAMDALPFYTIRNLVREQFLNFYPVAYENLSRDAPSNTSLYLNLRLRAPFWRAQDPVAPHLRILLVKLAGPSERDPFRPIYVQADLPKGEEMTLYDGSKGGNQNGFKVDVASGGGDTSIWVRRPAPNGPAYQNVPYLEPGRCYSVQFELAREPYLGRRYEATRFGVRPELPGEKLQVAADYNATTFVDWQGDRFNGHLLGADDTPRPFWGGDYLLQKQMRDQYPDLWRMIDDYYLTSHFSAMFFEGSNLYRDRSMRVVTKVEQTSPTEAVVTLAHFLGAR